MSRPPYGETDLLRLSPDELAYAPHQVLVSLVERYQDDLERHLLDAQAKQEELRSAKEDRAILERDLGIARKRIDELLGEQGRLDAELSGRVEVVDNLRATLRELEREKKEATRRYREQAETHESARQAWHDQEQHLKARIATLAASPRKAQRTPRAVSPPIEHVRAGESAELLDVQTTVGIGVDTSGAIPDVAPLPSPRSSTSADPATPPATELALIEELASLTIAHESLEANLRSLQTEMSDLKRVYQDLQDENESYEILLGERTLSGQVRDSHLFQSSVAWTGDSPTRISRLEVVGERDEEDLANGSVDLAAELDAAHAFGTELASDQLPDGAEDDRRAERDRAQRALEGNDFPDQANEDLRREVRALKDANKALTLYVSKIVDRVCQQEGFEKVLAVDYRLPTTESSPPRPDRRQRPASISFFGRHAPAISPLNGVAEPLTPSAATKSSGLLDSVTSVFGFSRSATITSPTPTAPMKPLVLAETARRLEPSDDIEDEDDRRERARIQAEMQQLGFSPSSRSAEEHRSSGFTEVPPRGMCLLAQRRASAIASSEPQSPVGLGIQAEGIDPARTTRSSAPPAVPVSPDPPAIRKALRRLSSAFSSSVVNSA